MDPMDNEFISIERPLSDHSSSTNAQQQTYLALDQSDTPDVASNVDKVKKSDAISTNQYIFLFSYPS